MSANAAAVATPADRIAELEACFSSERAFRAFYERALPKVYGYILHRCGGDEALAQDLVQTAFGEAIRQRRTFDGRADPVTWLVGIARHKLVDHFRTEEREERRRLRLVVHELEVDREVDEWQAAADRELLAAALARLTAMQRAVLILHYADGLPVRDVAREIGKSESATESLMTRAREALRDAYEEASHD